jgi:hypothetical protein
VTGLDLDAGRRLGEWLFWVGHRRSRLFDGFVCTSDAETLLCAPTREHEPLPVRWSQP